jgi:hypothetical protein
VRSLPATLPTEQRFQIARRVIGAEQQFITYREYLPAVGVKLPGYRGYDPEVNPSLGNEFATVAYRAHSMIHGEFEVTVAGRTVRVPLGQAFFNPDILPTLGLGPILAGLADEAQYKNDEQIDDSLRSVLFQVPGPGVADPIACFTTPSTPGCFQGVVDLGALDVERGRDHGMPTYNEMRRAFGLVPRKSFRAITGERSDSFPADRELDAAHPVDDPDSLDFVKLLDADGNAVKPGSDAAAEDVRVGVRRTPLAARLRAIYGSVKKVDTFVGLVSEPHVRGSEFGELQRAIWTQQFDALRTGDRFFYRNDPALDEIRAKYGVDYRHTLSDLIALNTNVPRADLPANAFFAPAD